MSVTVQVTVVLPTGKELGALFTIVATAQLSAVNGEPKATLASARAQAPASLGRFSAAGAEMVGASVSFTITVKLVVAVLPAASVAVAVTVVTPVLNTLPLGGEHTRVTLPLQLSVAVGA